MNSNMDRRRVFSQGFMQRSRLLVVLGVIALISACSLPRIVLFKDSADPLQEFTLEGSERDKILLIPLQGMISDSPQKSFLKSAPSMVQHVMSQLQKAEKDKRIKAILLKVNSPGGTITASDILYHEILEYKKRTGAKIIISMLDLAASGAYYLSLPADMIMAHPTTLTGSIGVIFLRPKVHGLMDKIGLGIDVVKSGKNKDMGSPFRESSREEEEMMQKSVNDFGERFIHLVQKHRQLKQPALDEISTARVFTADEALQLGLVDKIGYLRDAVQETKKMAGLAQDAKVVVYRRTKVPDDNYYNISGMATGTAHIPVINLALPEVLDIAGFYYIWAGAIRADK